MRNITLSPQEAITRAQTLVRNTHQTFDTSEARRIMAGLLVALNQHLFKNLNADSGKVIEQLSNPLVPK